MDLSNVFSNVVSNIVIILFEMSIFPVQTPRDLSTMYCRGLLLLTASRCHPEGFNKRTLQGTAHINVGNTAGPHSMVYRWRPGLWAGSTDSAQPAMSWLLGKVQRMPPQYQGAKTAVLGTSTQLTTGLFHC